MPGSSPFQEVNGCSALAAVAEPVAVVAPLNDVQQPARWARVRVVVDGKQPPEYVERHVKRVPEPGGDLLELRAVGPASIDVAAFAAAGKRHAVAADQPVIGPQVLAQAEVDVAGKIKREAGEPVVRVVARRVEPDESAPAACRAFMPSALPSPSRSQRR